MNDMEVCQTRVHRDLDEQRLARRPPLDMVYRPEQRS